LCHTYCCGGDCNIVAPRFDQKDKNIKDFWEKNKKKIEEKQVFLPQIISEK
jgi:hypothetical protein